MRLKDNAMLKSEYESKMKKLQDKWAEVEALTGDNIPRQEDIEQMVGLVDSKIVVKSVHEMLKERKKDGELSTEDHIARQFVKRMRNEAKERDKLKD